MVFMDSSESIRTTEERKKTMKKLLSLLLALTLCLTLAVSISALEATKPAK